ncbi:hypothetical protein V6N12_055671 [Hibiscus sabdariffa]|uniref:Uncharacterized protein n=1 Tax=Hibiscus sabdariffa TaxID=183260 RepID=A0ABR2AL81_9ROSI
MKTDQLTKLILRHRREIGVRMRSNLLSNGEKISCASLKAKKCWKINRVDQPTKSLSLPPLRRIRAPLQSIPFVLKNSSQSQRVHVQYCWISWGHAMRELKAKASAISGLGTNECGIVPATMMRPSDVSKGVPCVVEDPIGNSRHPALATKMKQTLLQIQ